MAATDQTYRNQKILDIVFAVSCVLMLVSIVAMFAQDYNRAFKVEQRLFRDVEEAMADRLALRVLPEPEKIKEAEGEVEAARQIIASKQAEINQVEQEIKTKLPEKIRKEAAFQAVKADYDSQVSLYNIAVEQRGLDSPQASELRAKVEELQAELAVKQREMENATTALNESLAKEAELKKPLTDALANLKKLNNEFDRVAKNAAQKRWGWGDTIRNLPVLDAFAAPTRIQQFTLEELPIDYNFKRVTRYDRCMTCHQGIDRANFDRASLEGLREVSQDQADKLEEAKNIIRQREALLQGTGEELGYDASALRLTTLNLSDARVSEFVAHPRLDLFVDANSPHPAEKFGCTSCHSGQGSATDFINATHTPNTTTEKHRWEHDHHWHPIHFWDFPMLPKRFTESGCVKCHYQVTDLIREGNKIEAPKLFEGYNLVRRAGCFGCHEIAGIKSGREVGPDLRLEPSPPLEALTPAQRVQMQSDPLNPPGTMRKVGPSLRRLGEKTNEEWVRMWIRAPREFRPNTWMPHYYGLSNNDPDALQGTGQEAFPDAEINSISHYLFQKSQAYLKGEDPFRKANLARKAYLEDIKKSGLLSEKQLRELENITHYLHLEGTPVPIAERITDEEGRTVQLPPAAKDAKARQEQETRGRQLFTERGCLACHTNQGTTTAALGLPAVTSDAQFGPDLSRVAAKLGTRPGDQESARRWLVQWIMKPTVHSPRTLMPITHLTVDQADDIAVWLLSQKVEWTGPEVRPPDLDTLKKLARVHLDRVTTRQAADDLLNPQSEDARQRAQDWLKDRRPESDESELAAGINEDTLKSYIGRKAIGYLGCFGCHDIPGFEASKPIGTPLNDWGRKDPERLAFEDIMKYVDQHYHIVDRLQDEDGQPVGFEDGKAPYEEFYADLLSHRQREGFLQQKLREPRSYDYARLRTWDERLRMPQFKFARPVQKAGESDEAFQVRRELEEAQAREQVMTFILGLVAEPIPPRYVYAPGPGRHAEIQGRKILDKFNCGGCHQIQPGIYDFKKTPDVLDQLENFYQTAQQTAAGDHVFPESTAWVGLPPKRADIVSAHGVPIPDSDDPNLIILRLTDALRFTNTSNEERNIPAGSNIGLATDVLNAPPAEPYGGMFSELLPRYLAQMNPTLYKEYKNARAALPPPLFRQGEKVQPSWLFQFLRNPGPIRPVTVLRMPKFSLSDDEAMTLVNYFAASDKSNNPGMELNYPYLAIPQREDSFWEAKTTEYVKRLGEDKVQERLKAMQPFWEQLLRNRITEAERNFKNAEAIAKAAKDDTRKEDEKNRDALKKELDGLKAQLEKRSFEELNRRWLEKEAYAADSYRLLANYNTPCLSCHQVGNLPPKAAQGPPLDLTWERLRPTWTLQWIANPERLISYPTPMPQNFLRDKPPYPEFVGTPMEQVTAVRDILMNLPRVADMPANRYFRPGPGGEGGTK